MAERLGNVLFGLGLALGALFAIGFVWSAQQDLPNPAGSLALWAAFAIGSVVAGWAFRYILRDR
jgi:hypothetical protein